MIGLLMHSVLRAFTHSVVWASVLSSAFVALVVTLVVEYFAKPGLEARKDRILETSRERRNAIKKVKRASYLAANLLTSHTSESPDSAEDNTEWTSMLNDRAYEMAVEMDELAESAFELINVPRRVESEWVEATGIMSGFAMLFQINNNLSDDHWEKLRIARARMHFFAELLRTSRWRRSQRYALMIMIKSSNETRASAHTSSEEDNSLSD
jgi:hypothetical protein